MELIKKSAPQKGVHYPTKRTVNLAKRESRKQSVITLAVGVFIIIVLCCVVAKVGVIDQFARLNAAEKAYNEVHAEYLEMQQAVAEYPAVEQEYHTYSRRWMQTDESIAVSVDRSEVLDMLEDELMAKGNVKTFMVDEDTVLVTMSGMNLEEISLMMADIQQLDIVKSTALTIASTTKAANEDVDFSVTIILQAADTEEAAS